MEAIARLSAEKADWRGLVTVAKAVISGGEALSMRVDTYVQSVKLLLGLSLRSYESDG